MNIVACTPQVSKLPQNSSTMPFLLLLSSFPISFPSSSFLSLSFTFFFVFLFIFIIIVIIKPNRSLYMQECRHKCTPSNFIIILFFSYFYNFFYCLHFYVYCNFFILFSMSITIIFFVS